MYMYLSYQSAINVLCIIHADKSLLEDSTTLGVHALNGTLLVCSALMWALIPFEI